MPVVTFSPEQSVQRRRNGGQFDRAVEGLAPMINQLRSAGITNIRELAKRLNAAGRLAPSGRPLTYGTMHRVLKRLNELRLGPGPRSLSTAAAQRAPRPYRPRRNHKRLIANALRQLLAERHWPS